MKNEKCKTNGNNESTSTIGFGGDERTRDYVVGLFGFVDRFGLTWQR
jgi:hypothetical protein